MINPNRPGGLMGANMKEHLEYLATKEAGEAFNRIRLHIAVDGAVLLYGFGEAIVLTDTGWFLEDTSGG